MEVKKKKIVVLSGSGISAESGISTFRDSGGLWEEYSIEEVATPQAWAADREKVLDFYNLRRKQLLSTEPNDGHKALVNLEKGYEVKVVTQNVDDLHERAGSSHVLHLHGELRKARSTVDPNLIYPIKGWELKLGDKCEKGSQLSPHVVWFGEAVTEMENAISITAQADILIVVGTSLQVYPAAGLLYEVQPSCEVFLIDPDDMSHYANQHITVIKEKAGVGLPRLSQKLMKKVSY